MELSRIQQHQLCCQKQKSRFFKLLVPHAKQLRALALKTRREREHSFCFFLKSKSDKDLDERLYSMSHVPYELVVLPRIVQSMRCPFRALYVERERHPSGFEFYLVEADEFSSSEATED